VRATLLGAGDGVSSPRRPGGGGRESLRARGDALRGRRTDRPAHGATSADGGGRGSVWTQDRAERQLRSLELFGMRFGLDRMRRMMTALGSPQARLDAIQVLGTNGKTSTTRMLAAILERHGLRTGAYTSPHLVSYRERIRVAGRELSPDEFVAAVARASRAAEHVNRTLAEDDHVTQFELLTAAALWEMARCEVDVAVVEAGLGGRYDATSVIEAPVSVLTNVGLEHTRWLGPTVADIAEEKLAALAPRGTLVIAADLAEDALAVARRVTEEREAQLVRADPAALDPALGADQALAARGRFQRSNFALAVAAARAHLLGLGIQLDQRAVADAAGETTIAGRLEIVDAQPLTVFDGAHNPHAVRALVESLGDLVGDRDTALVMGVLDDKDAARMLEALLAVCRRVWFTAPPSPRALPPATLQSLARQLGYEHTACEPRPGRALRMAREWAAQAPPDSGEGRAVLVTGSVYLVGALLGGEESAEGVR
jgi:dihydrofolate synthase / folylpolyglutamate synthase